ncbi:hypothetical protein CW706_03440 [Candidatus Bathyarchaeota archaeon]|nr:MAG: hypothetical protein CW706_03440 [Candidatus Bathyarchaeota archaeon]
MKKRIPTGVDGLDDVLGGGFPRGSLILITGNPGTGKTVFSARFLYRGAVEYGENGVYVNFSEDRETFYENMRLFGFDFERLEKEGRFRYLDFLTVRETGVSSILNMILEEISRIKAKRLVIDLFSAIAQAFERPHDARILVHTVLGRIVRKAGCTTLMIVEVPFGEERIGLGMEEFVADGVLNLERKEYEKSLLRELSILKLRGTRVAYPKLAFTLEGGFQVFPPITVTGISEPEGRYRIIPHSKESFSMGIRDLDHILKGMFRKGNYDLLEIEGDVVYPLEKLTRPTICNFLNQGHGVVVLPPQGLTGETIRSSILPYVEEKESQSNFKVIDYAFTGKERSKDPNIISLRGASILEDLERFWSICSELRKKTGKSVLSVVGYDSIEYIYGEKDALKTLGEDVARIRNNKDVRINIIRPTAFIASQLGALSHIHLKVKQIDGALFLHGIKPETPLLNINLTEKEGFSEIKLIPIL